MSLRSVPGGNKLENIFQVISASKSLHCRSMFSVARYDGEWRTLFLFYFFFGTCHLLRKRKKVSFPDSCSIAWYLRSFFFLRSFNKLHRCLLVVICFWLITGKRDLTVLHTGTHLFLFFLEKNGGHVMPK